MHPDSLVFSIGDRDSDTKMPLGINGCFLAWTNAFIQAVNVYCRRTFSSDKREAPRVNRRGWRCAAGPNFRRNYVKPLMIT
jgi:hypothetical protein